MIHQQFDVDRLRAANKDVVRRFIEAINDSWNVEAMRAMVTEGFLNLAAVSDRRTCRTASLAS